MNTLKYIAFGLVAVAVVAAGVVIFNGSAAYRTQQDAKSITIQISSSAPLPGE